MDRVDSDASSAVSDLRAPAPSRVRDVWAWNFDFEFALLIAFVASLGPGAVAALDTEFPGFVREEPRWVKSRAARYEAVRASVDLLQPIQVGVAFGAPGEERSAWNFHLRFDVDADLHVEKSVEFLKAAGVDFQRHATEGLDAATLGHCLAASPLLFGENGSTLQWTTFSGLYDWGYLLKLLSAQSLPPNVSAFETTLSTYFPLRAELRDWLPHGSLESLLTLHGVARHGCIHTAGSDALATLDLFFLVASSATSGDSAVLDLPSEVASAATSSESAVSDVRAHGMPTAAVLPEEAVVSWVAAARWAAACERGNGSADGGTGGTGGNDPDIAQIPAASVAATPEHAATQALIHATEDSAEPTAAPTASWGAAARRASSEERGSMLGSSGGSPEFEISCVWYPEPGLEATMEVPTPRTTARATRARRAHRRRPRAAALA